MSYGRRTRSLPHPCVLLSHRVTGHVGDDLLAVGGDLGMLDGAVLYGVLHEAVLRSVHLAACTRRRTRRSERIGIGRRGRGDVLEKLAPAYCAMIARVSEALLVVAHEAVPGGHELGKSAVFGRGLALGHRVLSGKVGLILMWES